MLTHTPYRASSEATPVPVLAVLYRKSSTGKSWKITRAATAGQDLDFCYLLTGTLEFTDAAGNDPLRDSDGWINLDDTDLNGLSLWVHKSVPGLRHKGEAITPGQAWERGLLLLKRPLADTQYWLDRAEHEDTLSTTYCEICQGTWTSEEHCCHLRWSDGGGGMCEGVGAQDVDQAEVKQSLRDLWELIDPAKLKRWAEAMEKGTFDVNTGDEWRTRVHIDLDGGGRYYWSAIELNLDYLVGLCGDDDSDAEALFWPGIAWLSSLDNHPRCKPYKQITLGWLQEFLHSRHYTLPTAVFYHRANKEEWQRLSSLRAGNTLAVSKRRLKKCLTRNTLEFLSELSATTHAQIYDPASGQECLYRIERPRQTANLAGTRIAYVIKSAGQGSPWTLPDYDLLED